MEKSGERGRGEGEVKEQMMEVLNPDVNTPENGLNQHTETLEVDPRREGNIEIHFQPVDHWPLHKEQGCGL